MSQAISSQPQTVQECANSNANNNINQWHSGVFDFYQDMDIFFSGTFCPFSLARKMAKDYGECCCVPMYQGTIVAMRTGMRERYHIPGSICEDWVLLTFLGPCTLCQMARELKVRQ